MHLISITSHDDINYYIIYTQCDKNNIILTTKYALCRLLTIVHLTFFER